MFHDLWPPHSFQFIICKSLYHWKLCNLYIWTMSLKSHIVKWYVFVMVLGVLLKVWKILFDQNHFPSLYYEVWTSCFLPICSLQRKITKRFWHYFTPWVGVTLCHSSLSEKTFLNFILYKVPSLRITLVQSGNKVTEKYVILLQIKQ
jgi:hypothetical protein